MDASGHRHRQAGTPRRLPNRSEIADCTDFALEWLSESGGVTQSLCLARREGETTLAAIGVATGSPGSAQQLHDARSRTGASADPDSHKPAPHVLPRRDGLRPRAAPSSVDAVRAERVSRVAAARIRRHRKKPSASCSWAERGASRRKSSGSVRRFALRLAQLLRRLALSEGDRKQEYERSLLRAIVNAVTDPILLTDAEGRLLIANARARSLFVASEEESEGRRGAVGMNNMLLSSALSSKAIEETGAMRRELLLVNPVDGSDLLFELLARPSPKTRATAPASCRFCGTSATSAAPPSRSKRTTARCGSRKCRRAPSAIA